MAGRDVVFLTGVCHPNSFNRAQGAYRLASVIRDNGYSVSVVDGVGSLKGSQIRDMLEMVLLLHSFQIFQLAYILIVW